MKKTNRFLAFIFVFSTIMNCIYSMYSETGLSFIFFISAGISIIALISRAISLALKMRGNEKYFI